MWHIHLLSQRNKPIKRLGGGIGVCVCVCVCVRARVHACVYMCVYVCVPTRTHMCMHVCVCVWIFIWLFHRHSPPPPQTFFKGFITKYIFLNLLNISLEDAEFKSRMHFLSRLEPGRQYRENLHKIVALRSISQLMEWNGKCILILTYQNY